MKFLGSQEPRLLTVRAADAPLTPQAPLLFLSSIEQQFRASLALQVAIDLIAAVDGYYLVERQIRLLRARQSRCRGRCFAVTMTMPSPLTFFQRHGAHARFA